MTRGCRPTGSPRRPTIAGRKIGDEEPGRSQLVMTMVRDTIRATLPSLIRVFTAVENPVEFIPTVSDNEQLGELHAELARQATSYANWALFTANRGWMILHDHPERPDAQSRLGKLALGRATAGAAR